MLGRVRGLAIGPRGEASPDFHKLAQKIAGGASSFAEVKAIIAPRISRALGINAVRPEPQLA